MYKTKAAFKSAEFSYFHSSEKYTYTLVANL